MARRPVLPQSKEQPQLSVSLTLLGSADTALGSKCITTDNADDIWVCNPNTGAVLQIKDTLPTSVH